MKKARDNDKLNTDKGGFFFPACQRFIDLTNNAQRFRSHIQIRYNERIELLFHYFPPPKKTKGRNIFFLPFESDTQFISIQKSMITITFLLSTQLTLKFDNFFLISIKIVCNYVLFSFLFFFEDLLSCNLFSRYYFQSIIWDMIVVTKKKF